MFQIGDYEKLHYLCTQNPNQYKRGRVLLTCSRYCETRKKKSRLFSLDYSYGLGKWRPFFLIGIIFCNVMSGVQG